MSQPLRMRLDEESKAAPVTPQLTVLPPPFPATVSESSATPPGAFPPHNYRFLAPEEIDIQAGFRQQEALDATIESPWKGCVGGALAALASTLAAGGTAALTGYWYGFFSIGIGFVVAFGVLRNLPWHAWLGT